LQVEVRLFANLARYLPPGARGNTATIEIPDGTTVDELIHRLAIPEELAHLTLVNGRDAQPGDRLAPGDVVSVLPPLEGG
jgi:molybdopterin converting factor small subunit